MVRRPLVLSLALVMAAVPLAASPATAGHARADHGHGRGGQVDRIELPRGWQPEGVTTDGRRVYSGSLATGQIIVANPRNGRARVLPRSETGTPAVGIDYDKRRRVIWVAGGPEGEIRVQSARTGRVLRTYTLPPQPGGRFVNDLVVTRRAVYATDSFNQELGVVPLRGRRLPPSGEIGTLPLGGDISFGDGFNANGIVASGRWLVLVQSNAATLYRVNPRTGKGRAIDLDGYLVTNGDGLELDRDLLYVVRNRLNLIAVVELDRRLRSGEVEAELTSPDFKVPTTVALVRDRLWAANARFDLPEEERATAEFSLTGLDEYEDD